MNGSSGKTIAATTRQLESLIRMSESHAKIRYCSKLINVRLSETVDIVDAQEALRLVKEALHSYAIDPLTGKIDMDLINTGKSSVWRENMQELKRQIKIFIQGTDRKLMDIQTALGNFKMHSSLVIIHNNM